MTMFRALVALLLMSGSTTPTGQPRPQQPGDFTPAAQSQVVSWQLKRVLPPSPLYVGVDDVLRVGAASNQTNEVLTVSYRLLRAADGKVIVGQFTTGTLVQYALTTKDQTLAEGFLLSVSCRSAVATTRGQTFARLYLNPKALGSGQPAQQLMADYVTTAMASGYPNGRVTSPQEGPGWIHAVQFTNQGHGKDWGETSGLLGRRRVMQVAAIITTSAVVANRVPTMVVLDNLLNTIGTYPVYTNIAASSSFRVTWAPAGTGGASILNQLVAPIASDLILPAGYSIQSLTALLDTNTSTGDTWTLIFATYEEWLDNV